MLVLQMQCQGNHQKIIFINNFNTHQIYLTRANSVKYAVHSCPQFQLVYNICYKTQFYLKCSIIRVMKGYLLYGDIMTEGKLGSI